MSGPESHIDHDRLADVLRATLDLLSHLRIDRNKIKLEDGSYVTSGAFGDVHRGTLRLGWFKIRERPSIAVKKLRPAGDSKQRLRVAAALARELRVWAGLVHENILKLEAFHLDDNFENAWIVTLWQVNGCITTYIEVKRPSMDVRLQLAADTARGLAYLHGLSPPVCHGDIKGANTLVNERGSAMLCDFGLARVLEEIPSGLTTRSAKIGTLRYVSPELMLASSARHTRESDVWAWGCLFLEVTTDQIPYREAGLERSVILEITQNKLPAMVSTIAVPDFAKNIFRRCWSPDPAGRPPISWCYVSLVSKYASGPIPPPPIPSMAVPPRRSEDYAPTTGASTSSSPYNPYGGSSMSSPFSDRSLSPYNPYAESLPSPPESPPVQTPGSPWNPYSRVPQTAGPSTAFADVYTTTDRPAWEPSSQPSTPFGSFPGGTPGSRKTSNPFRTTSDQ